VPLGACDATLDRLHGDAARLKYMFKIEHLTVSPEQSNTYNPSYAYTQEARSRTTQRQAANRLFRASQSRLLVTT